MGFAVNLHGFSRPTGNPDIWIEDETGNRKKLGKALLQFGYGELSFEDFVLNSKDFHIGSGLRSGIITAMAGLKNISPDDALTNANIAQIYDVKVPFLISISLSKIRKLQTGQKILLM